tara:strand:- start:145 stop:507 length:363 start_codon:yes stop_codon:yes gene_type:complete
MNQCHEQSLRTEPIAGPYINVLKENPNVPGGLRKLYESLQDADNKLEQCAEMQADYQRLQYQVRHMQEDLPRQLETMRRQFVTVDMANVMQAQINRLQAELNARGPRRMEGEESNFKRSR